MPALHDIKIHRPFIMRINLPGRIVCLLGVSLFTSCAHIDVKQIAYETLRQEDCRINQLDDFCTRTFASEYLEYTRLRRDFMRGQTQVSWRVSHEERLAHRDSIAR